MKALPAKISIELSWEEIKPAIRKYFDFKEEDLQTSLSRAHSSVTWIMVDLLEWIDMKLACTRVDDHGCVSELHRVNRRQRVFWVLHRHAHGLCTRCFHTSGNWALEIQTDDSVIDAAGSSTSASYFA